MYNEIKFNSTKSIKNGVDKLVNAVKVTLGPRGKNVIIANPYGYPHVTKDGATVASSITLKDQTENIGAMLVRDAAIRTAREAGDGSTSSSIYAQCIFNYLNSNCKDTTSVAKDKLIDVLDDFKTKLYDESMVTNREMIIDVASLSANNDRNLGEFIYNVFENIGISGNISISNSQSVENSVKYINGVKLNSGLISTNFISNKEKGVFEEENVECHVILNNINTLDDIKPYIMSNNVINDNPKLLIVKHIDEYVLNTMIYNVNKGMLKLAIIKLPGFGTSKELYYKAIIDKLGEKSTVDKVICSMSECVIACEGLDTTVEAEKIKNEIDNYNPEGLNTYDIETLKDIYNIYYGKSAIIYIGGYSEGEIKEKMDRAEDALMAIKSAYETGCIYGSGLTVHKIINKWIEEGKNDVYYNCIINALSEPLHIMCNTSGIKLERVLDIMNETEFTKLMNFKTLEIENVENTKIIEPAKVSICALTNAINIAILLLSTHCIIEYNE